MEKSSCLKSQGLDILYLASPCGPILFKKCHWDQIWTSPRGHIGLYKINFSEYGHAAYQIIGNEAYNNMLANSVSLLLPLALKLGQKVIFVFSESSHVPYQINRNEV